jgi:hypothetical protein
MFIHQRADQGERLRPRLRVYDLFDAIQRGTDLSGQTIERNRTRKTGLTE